MEINFIPIDRYSFIFFTVLFIVTMLAFVYVRLFKINDSRNLNFITTCGYLVLVFVLGYIGLRPVDEEFGDMPTYNRHYEYYEAGYPIRFTKDIFFHMFMKYCASIMSSNNFFLLSAILYIVPLFIVSKKWFGKYWFYMFLMLVGSLSFWGYGVNGIRNGIATSLFILAISRDRLVFKIILLLLAVFFHKTLLLPTAAYIISIMVNKPKYYFFFWLATIPLSLLFAGFWENLFASFIEDDRASYLLDNGNTATQRGFRWDFLVYSSLGVLAGYYYIFMNRFRDVLYSHILNIYLLANGIWILVIRANYSNRFAYLSWFLLALVIFYPLLLEKFFKNQNRKLGLFMFIYVSITYLLNVVLKNNDI